MIFTNLFIISLHVVFISTAINDSKNTEQNENEEEIKAERIIGATLIDYNGQFPFQVAILLNDYLFCPGSLLKTGLLKNRVIVTTAYCLTLLQQANGNITVRYNTIDWTTGPTVDVERAIVNPYYNEETSDNDIGLLLLSSTIPEGINAKPIEISRVKDPVPGSTIIISGWGFTSVNGSTSEYLRYAYQKVVERTICNDTYAAIEVIVTRNMFCAINPTNSPGSGDDGAPATQDGKLIGLASFTSGPGVDPYIPVGYTRVYNYITWIKRNINFNSRN